MFVNMNKIVLKDESFFGAVSETLQLIKSPESRKRTLRTDGMLTTRGRVSFKTVSIQK